MYVKSKKILAIVVGIVFIMGLFILQFRRKGNEIVALYPKAEESFVGDPMPYYDGDEFAVYYLEDLRDGQIGFHPFSLMRTKDFLHYEDIGEVIPYVNEEDSPEKALGTGSIIKDDKGEYHAFYTGHNGSLSPKEVIMHATSKDGENWDKIPEDTFKGGEHYERDDFRDPYVFWNDEVQEYWMLITTRYEGKGVIAKYVSSDLKKWEDTGVFFENDMGNDSNLECPSLVYYDGKWILAFSDQWDQRVIHYRVAESSNGPFEDTKPQNDYFDGAGFYAGRLETDGENLYAFGWIPTKEEHDDRFGYNWAGNLAVHQLHFKEGRLVPSLPKTALDKRDITKLSTQTLSAGEKYELEDAQNWILSGELTEIAPDTQLILKFSEENIIVLDFENEKMSYHNQTLDRLSSNSMKSTMPLPFSESVNLTIVKEGQIMVIYTDNHALSNRAYKSDGKGLTIEVLKGQVTFSE